MAWLSDGKTMHLIAAEYIPAGAEQRPVCSANVRLAFLSNMEGQAYCEECRAWQRDLNAALMPPAERWVGLSDGPKR